MRNVKFQLFIDGWEVYTNLPNQGSLVNHSMIRKLPTFGKSDAIDRALMNRGNKKRSKISIFLKQLNEIKEQKINGFFEFRKRYSVLELE